MILEQIEVGPMKNLCYIVGDPMTKEGAIIDCGWEAKKLHQASQKHGLKITKILLTHAHFDHVKALGELHDLTGAEILIHGDEPYTPDFSASTLTKLKEGDKIAIGKLTCKVLHTPGHSPGSACFLFGKKMITGDALFVGGCGRVDLPGSDPTEMHHSLQRLKSMDDDIEIYPGHDYGSAPHSTLGHEKKHNPFLKKETMEEFFGIRLK
jgi:hydroxyacylglutathione hydrolase